MKGTEGREEKMRCTENDKRRGLAIATIRSRAEGLC